MGVLNPVEAIATKRDGGRLSTGQITAFVDGYTAGRIPDYQMAALAMAIVLRGMDTEETAALTDAMLTSGDTLRWDDGTPRVDKHSTGGIGDKVSLILAPLLACSDVRVPMISGRGLGPTGGTLDKLESIPGFRTALEPAAFQAIVDRLGCAIAGASARIAPADRKLYALRDVTGTVPSVALITASIMSKKLAEGLTALVLDVKYGSGAFMVELPQARALAQSLVATGQRMGVATSALITDMNQPLGQMVGNALEVNEAVDVLAGKGPADVRQLVLELGAEVLLSADGTRDRQATLAELAGHLDSGAAAERFAAMVAAQGGRLDAPRPLAAAHLLEASRDGYLQAVDGRQLGHAVIAMGGGRRVAGDGIDHSTGIQVHARLGDRVAPGDPVATIYYDRHDIDAVRERVRRAFHLGDQPVPPSPLIAESIS